MTSTVQTVLTTPYPDQQPGTSGLRKPVRTFQQRLLARRGHLGIMTGLYHERIPFGTWWYLHDSTHVCFYHEHTMRWIAHHFRWAVALPAPNVAIFTMGAWHGVA